MPRLTSSSLGIAEKASFASPLRDPDKLMRSTRLGAFHQTRLSFSRALIRRMRREEWQIQRQYMDIGIDNVGEALYLVNTPQGIYSFLAFAHSIDPRERTDRAIAEVWDYTFVLCEGHVDELQKSRLCKNLPHQDAGRYETTELVFSRANKSGRLFDDVVSSLAKGKEPAKASIADIGYLIRTTAVFANGKFGIADYSRLRHRSGLPHSFEAQMLAVYLIRQFSIDTVHHLSEKLAPQSAIKLSSATQRLVGVGNATGLGMAPFLVDHPKLFNAWVSCRETAIARVISLPNTDKATWQRFVDLLQRAIRHVKHWKTADGRQRNRLIVLERELRELSFAISSEKSLFGPDSEYPWKKLMDEIALSFSPEAEEMLASLILEPHGFIVDTLEEFTDAKEVESLWPEQAISELLRMIEDAYSWAIKFDFSKSNSHHYFWYRSTVKSEPRLGISGADDGQHREMIVGIAREIASLHSDLIHLSQAERETTSIGMFLLRNSKHRATVERVQTLSKYPYAEIRDNLLASDCLPVDLLRCKLAFFGATKFDPKSDRWVRVVLFQGAPVVEDLFDADYDCDDWLFAIGSEV